MEISPDKLREWERWLQDHLDSLFLYARRRTPCEADAEDLVQQALAESWQRGAPELPLVLTIIRRRAIDLGRSRSAREAREGEIALRMEPGWLRAEAESRDDAAYIAAQLAALPPAQQEVVELHLWSGLTFREIGEVVGVPTHTAASRFKAALARLRLALKDFEPDTAHESR